MPSQAVGGGGGREGGSRPPASCSPAWQQAEPGGWSLGLNRGPFKLPGAVCEGMGGLTGRGRANMCAGMGVEVSSES